ncbi:MAG: histidine phosphatase family protein [Bryobacteraceae bacterium]|nr:histidine phosphatase family protein [Bryobacteraceae bacterium]
MSTLTLVRHGQARAFEQDSDRLSELGEQQARLLGEWWAARGVRFDEVYCGTLERQRRTAELAGHAAPIVNPAWNEYDAHGVLAMAAREDRFTGLLADYERHRWTPEANRYFQRVFEAAMTQWVSGELASREVESWEDFRGRVTTALLGIIERQASGLRVLVVTSGGPIGACVQHALGAPPEKALELNWRVRNSSISDFLFRNGRISLDSFNTLPHLPGPALISYR